MVLLDTKQKVLLGALDGFAGEGLKLAEGSKRPA
jgi:hypothetical protein